MMESCLAWKPDRGGPLEVDDIRKDLFQDYSSPTPDKTNIKQLKVNVQKENLQVYLRIRPITTRESTMDEPQDCVSLEGEDTVVLKAPSYCQSSWHSEKNLPQTVQKFNFTKVLGPDSSQRQVFEGTVSPLVRGVLEGRDAVVFTYGVTNAGKTFTFLGPEHDAGILPRALSVLFRSIEGLISADCSLKPQRCKDVTKLTRLQQTNEATLKNQLLKLLKQSDSQKLSSSQSSTCSSEGDSRISSASTSADSSANSSANISANSSTTESDSFQLNVDSTTVFSVWVSFCEIYRENIHDLLETQEPRSQKRNLLRLAQDVKGNSFIKDLRWVQVHSAEEAYRIMKIGKKNQSLFATKLNQLSSRSHSMFSIRILRLEKTGLMRVKSVSELCLCDLAGSERCTRTQSQGQRLKEAGNINTSLLTLGKCLNAMRLNQHHRIQQHVPFRESKLTHFLQGFLCGRGAVCMIVNISQCPSAYDETLNVLKFSALAQKVVVLTSRPILPPVAPKRTARELSMIINQADRPSERGRKSSMVAWETSLEDVLEEDDDDDDDDTEEDEDEECMAEETVLEAGNKEGGLREALELQIREEVSAEFMVLFESMEKHYSERLVREREILEEKAENRMEIMKTLVSKTSCLSATNEEERKEALEQMVTMMAADLQKIKRDAEEAHTCLTDNTELETLRLEQQRSHDQLETLRLEQQSTRDLLKATQERVSDLMEACQQKDDILGNLQVSMETADTQLTRLQRQLREKTDTEASLSKLLEDAKSRLQILELRLEEKSQSVDLLTQEADALRQETTRRREEKEEGDSVFHAAVEEMRREGQDAVEKSAQKRQHIAQLQKEMDQLRDVLTSSQKECVQLRADLAKQREESLDLRQTWQTDKGLLQQQAEGLTVQLKASEESRAKGTIVEERLAESETQCAALQQRLSEKDLADEERKAQDEGEKEELRLALSSLQERLTESQTETSSSEPNSHTSGQEEEGEEEEESGAEEVRGGVEEVVSREADEVIGVVVVEEERKATVVEELKEELQRFHQRKEEERRRAEFEAVKREVERLQEREKQQKPPNTRSCRKRKSEAHPNTRNLRRRKVQELQENDTKRNRRGETQVQAPDGRLQRILNSPSLLSSTAKSILGLVVNRSGEKGAVVVETKQKRGRKRLFKKDISSPLPTLTPHDTTTEGSA